MREKTQKKAIMDMMKRPIPRKWVGVVTLQMVREGKMLYGTKRFTSAVEAVDMVRPLFEQADREIMLVMSVNAKLEPMAVEIAAVGGVDSCVVDIKNIFKHALLNNASYVICFHNHPSGYPNPSREDKQFTERLIAAGQILNLPVLDHVIVGFKERGELAVFPDSEFASCSNEFIKKKGRKVYVRNESVITGS